MVIDKKIDAVLDQKNKTIEFSKNLDVEKMTFYNTQIGELCNDIESLLKEIFEAHPEMKRLEQ